MSKSKKEPTGNDLKKVRKAMRFTQQDLANYWSLSRVTVGQWERLADQVLPHPKMMAILIAELESRVVEY